MTKLTNEQIEETITQAHENILAVQEVSRDPRVIDPCVVRNLRACFTAGVDHGGAIMLEKAEQMLAAPVASAAHEALGRAYEAVCDWVDAKVGRSFVNCAPITENRMGGNYAFGAGVLLGDDERDQSHIVDWTKFFYGASRGEAMAKLAQWCSEHAVRVDTIPAPPSQYLAEDGLPMTLPRIDHSLDVEKTDGGDQ